MLHVQVLAPVRVDDVPNGGVYFWSVFAVCVQVSLETTKLLAAGFCGLTVQAIVFSSRDSVAIVPGTEADVPASNTTSLVAPAVDEPPPPPHAESMAADAKIESPPRRATSDRLLCIECIRELHFYVLKQDTRPLWLKKICLSITSIFNSCDTFSFSGASLTM